MPSSHPDDESRSEPDESAPLESPPRVYQSDELFRGRREIWIEHGDVLYRLRITSAGKLILTK